MILIRNLTKSILKKSLFQELSLTIHKGDKIGIVGPNGGGKTTLLKIIAGIENADSGTVDLEKERIGYLPQDPDFQDSESVESYLSAPSHKVEKALNLVGLKVDTDVMIKHLSGGQKTRLALAKVLIENPSVILLDEPTNHLDKSALSWLRDFINDFRGAILIVSHDRYLLNNSVSRIIEIDPVNQEVNEFVGGYDDYLEGKKLLIEKREETYALQERKRKKMEDWIRHRQDIASAIPNPAMGKQIQMMKRRLQREVVDQELDKPLQYRSLVNKSLSGEVPGGKLIIRLNQISKKFNDSTLFEDVSFELRGSERVLISGENGSGKTTLLRIIQGEEDVDTGTITIGPNINVGYFAQEHEVLNLDKKVEQEFLSTERLDIGSKSLRTVLGSFLFKGDEVFKKVAELSLGQRVRLIFAKLMNQKNELLVLDEPTNHLDIVSKESIEMALREYKGAMIVVSHDQYFLNQVGINTHYLLENGKLTKN